MTPTHSVLGWVTKKINNDYDTLTSSCSSHGHRLCRLLHRFRQNHVSQNGYGASDHCIMVFDFACYVSSGVIVECSSVMLLFDIIRYVTVYCADMMPHLGGVPIGTARAPADPISRGVYTTCVQRTCGKRLQQRCQFQCKIRIY